VILSGKIHDLGMAILAYADSYEEYCRAEQAGSDGALLSALSDKSVSLANVMRVRALEAAPMIRSFLSKEPTVPPIDHG
jgi:hypothetical protein